MFNHIQELQQLVRRLDMLIANKNQETNRLEGLSDIVAANVQSHVWTYPIMQEKNNINSKKNQNAFMYPTYSEVN